MSARKTPTLVALGGHGDDEMATRQWAELMLPAGWRLEVPLAAGASWFETTARGVDTDSLARSQRAVAEAVDSAVATSGGPVAVAGYSQGAAMALALGDLPGLAGVIGVCPFLAESDDLDLSVGPPALLLPAADDDVVPAFLGEDAAAAMSGAGRTATAITVPGAHKVGGEAVTQAQSWLQKLVPGRMKISLGLPVDRVSSGAELVSGEAIGELAAAWERLGFDAAFVTDHPAPDDRWLAAGGHHALEPTVALSIAAAATSRLRLHTHVMVLAYRNPFLAAKAIASLDVVSAGRVILGVAAGYLRPEFDALGVDFEGRGALLDESISVLAMYSRERPSPLRGPTGVLAQSQRCHSHASCPDLRSGSVETPAGRCEGQCPRRRDGLRSPLRADSTESRGRRGSRPWATYTNEIGQLDEICAELGRADRPTVCFSPFSMGDYLAAPQSELAALVEEVAELSELGVDWLCLTVPGTTRPEVLERARQLSAALQLE